MLEFFEHHSYQMVMFHAKRVMEYCTPKRVNETALFENISLVSVLTFSQCLFYACHLVIQCVYALHFHSVGFKTFHLLMIFILMSLLVIHKSLNFYIQSL
jgi:hypothetical protein